MVRTEKVTVSLPKEDLKMIVGYETKLQLTRSAVFKEAIELWLAVREKEELRKSYKAAYSDSNVKDKTINYVEDMLPLALEWWSEY